MQKADDTKGLNQARVPEHSLALMQAFSRGQPLVINDYLFFHNQDWLMAIGYPLTGSFNCPEFGRALTEAKKQIKPRALFAIAREMPAAYEQHIIERDRYYLLPATAPIPGSLRNPVARAAQTLEVSESTEFTAAHRKLWAEFMQRNSAAMNNRVAGLYLKTPEALAHAGGSLRLLDATDRDGNISASLLLDCSPANFISYVIGAHSHLHYTPHATDLLFARMLEIARERGKRFIHLGLGVNEGILRFKRKWGAIAGPQFVMAQWEADQEEESAGRILARAILNSDGRSARQLLAEEVSQRPFAMLWRLEKNNRISWIAGTAHFFRHSFENSFSRLFRNVDNVIFEGPLDPAFMAQVDQAGRKLPRGTKPLIEYLTETEIRRLEQTVNGKSGLLAKIMGSEKREATDVRWLLRHAMPWYAFFTLWTRFLERAGWRQSVDMEAWKMAQAMGKKVIGMETLEEQLESLGSLPAQRAVNFFRSCADWKARARFNLKAYLAGDLERMMGSSAEFPTRTEHIVSRRDQRFRERMRPYLETGRTAVFVGSAHMVNLRHMLAEDGFKIRQTPYGLWPALHLGWRSLWRPDEQVKW